MDGREVTLPFAGAELSVRRASSSFLLLRAWGADVLWGLGDAAAYITLQPAFAGKVTRATTWRGAPQHRGSLGVPS